MHDLRRKRTGLSRALAFLVVSATLGGCKLLDKLGTHEGDPCSDNLAVCRGPEVALVCHDGKYVETPCRGPDGCRVRGAELTCDFTNDTESDRCPHEWEDQGRCIGSAGFVACRGGHYARFDCRGAKGCVTEGEKVSCDMSVVVEGDRCSDEGAVSCTKDAKTLLTCKKGKMSSPSPCRGPKGCHKADGSKIACDQSIAAEGDACDGGGACTADGAKLLECRDGKNVVAHVCREGPCKSEGDSVACANLGVAEPGDPCTGDIGACSVDRKAMLGCRAGSFAIEKRCACVVEGEQIRCR